MSASDRIYGDEQVFTFCGYVMGDEPSNLLNGYAVADSPTAAIDGMREHGFAITALASLAEVKQTIQILEMIAQKHPEVEPSEFVDVYPRNVTPYPEDAVFCFTGHVVDASGVLKSGFIAASNVQFVIDYLRGFGFQVESATSLADLRNTVTELVDIACNDPQGCNSHFINLKDAA
ncbi:hypothetical protein M4D49_27460 [Cupriavidus pauculus]|uniref:hypothetical protein n=1 Tax=Burkholderiaceae TaxID=119060 RepID=UPI0004935E18|nr:MULTISPECIES: hypothetical protein [Burkholderiaceae]MCM3609228.1 hypothetical protein [Cupriavidus pauculus]